MTRESIVWRMKEKDEIARQEGIKSIIVDFYVLLSKLSIIDMLNFHIENGGWNSYTYMKTHSPLYKKKV